MMGKLPTAVLFLSLLGTCFLCAAQELTYDDDDDSDCVRRDSEEFNRCIWISIEMMRLLHMASLATPLNETAFREKCLSFAPCVHMKECGGGEFLRKPLPMLPTIEQSCDAGIFMATDFWTCALKLKKGRAPCLYLMGHPPERPKGMYVSDKDFKDAECQHTIDEYNCLKEQIPSKCGMRTWIGLNKHLAVVNLAWKDRIKQKCAATRPFY